MKNLYFKCLRYLRIETQWRLVLLFIILTGLLVNLEQRVIEEKVVELQFVQSQKALVDRIPEFETILQQKFEVERELARRQENERKRLEAERKKAEELARQQAAPESAQEAEPTGPQLEGVTYINGEIAVLINGNIYEEGKTVGNYTVVSITMKEVVLTDNIKNEVITLEFPKADRAGTVPVNKSSE